MNILPTQVLPLTPTRPKVLITEQEVMLGSAAALRAPSREAPHRRSVTAWLAALWPEPRPHPPSRHDYTEHARLSRMMDRL
ncbi:hypothetical protein [Mycobacterium sp. GA-2829]|uniref:hypothetical protein n=1 Tax=Mycobacterium sp. GA-2829 TaxID=1772283 RepID=UPI00073FE905|nr:hypothetical protein [Mycobacterium sp. GA-2829]KUI26790.1 hypothetical protein AU194_04670 [Mycobacterium sp. GA-2829]